MRTLFPYQGKPAPVNDAPVAKITDASCTELACSFKGSTSSDWDGDPLTYSWDFGDTTDAVTTADASHTYGTPGARTVTLTVNDGKGHTDTDTVTVNPKENTAPTARITDASCTRLDCSFKGMTSSDPDGDPLTYSWDFGDTTDAVTTANATHTYGTPGARTVTLTVNDGKGHIGTDTVTATATDPAASQVAYVGSASSAGNRSTHSVTLPSGVKEGDTMVLFLGAASIAPTYGAPSGWTLLQSETRQQLHGRASLDEDGDRGGRGRERQGQLHLLEPIVHQVRPHRRGLPGDGRHHADRELRRQDRQRRGFRAHQPHRHRH